MTLEMGCERACVEVVIEGAEIILIGAADWTLVEALGKMMTSGEETVGEIEVVIPEAVGAVEVVEAVGAGGVARGAIAVVVTGIVDVGATVVVVAVEDFEASGRGAAGGSVMVAGGEMGVEAVIGLMAIVGLVRGVNSLFRTVVGGMSGGAEECWTWSDSEGVGTSVWGLVEEVSLGGPKISFHGKLRSAI